MEQLKSEQQFKQFIAQSKPTVAVFKAAWCGDCRFIEPFMPEVEKNYANRLAFIEVDRDQFPDLGSELNILGIPSFVGFSNGKELIRFVSKLRKSREEIEQFLDRVVEVSNATAK